MIPRLRLHEAYQFLVLTMQTKTKASTKKEIYSKYNISGRLQNGSSGVPKITIENVSEESNVYSTKKPTRVNHNDDSALKIKTIGENLKTDAKPNQSMDDQSEGDKHQRSISKENGKKTTRKNSKDNRRREVIIHANQEKTSKQIKLKKVKFE